MIRSRFALGLCTFIALGCGDSSSKSGAVDPVEQLWEELVSSNSPQSRQRVIEKIKVAFRTGDESTRVGIVLDILSTQGDVEFGELILEAHRSGSKRLGYVLYMAASVTRARSEVRVLLSDYLFDALPGIRVKGLLMAGNLLTKADLPLVLRYSPKTVRERIARAWLIARLTGSLNGVRTSELNGGEDYDVYMIGAIYTWLTDIEAQRSLEQTYRQERQRLEKDLKSSDLTIRFMAMRALVYYRGDWARSLAQEMIERPVPRSGPFADVDLWNARSIVARMDAFEEASRR